jgi:hypothetical protein
MDGKTLILGGKSVRLLTGFGYSESVLLGIIKHSVLLHRTSWLSGQQSFVFGRSRVQISARRPVILIEVFRSFPQSLQTNEGIAP